MADNFFHTAYRTGDSAKTLHEAGKYFDSCYLAGYVVECYMKILYKHLAKVDSSFTHELPKLKEQLRKFKSSSQARTLLKHGFWMDIELLCQQIYVSWDPKHRYDDSHSWDKTASSTFQKEVNKCLAKLSHLKTRGII